MAAHPPVDPSTSTARSASGPHRSEDGPVRTTRCGSQRAMSSISASAWALSRGAVAPATATRTAPSRYASGEASGEAWATPASHATHSPAHRRVILAGR